MAKGTKQFDEKVHHVVEEIEGDKGKGTILCVSSWTVDGRTGKPQLSKREKWQTEDGNWRKGAAKGLTGLDLLAILRDLPNIAQAMRIPSVDIQLALNEESRKPKAKAEAF